MPDSNNENRELNLRMALLEESLAEKEKALEALQASENRYRRLFESAKDGILILDVDTGKVMDVNPFMTRLLGYPYEAFCGKYLWEIGAFKDISASKEAFRTLQDHEYVRYEDLPLQTREGKHVDVEFVSNIYVEDHKKVIQCNIRDITNRKRTEEALRASRRMIEEIVNAIPVRVFWKDRDLVYQGCNSIFARDAGFTDPKEVIGKDDFQMAWREQAECYRADDRRVIESGCSKPLIEESQTTIEGKTITVLTSKIPLRNSRGEIGGVIGTYYDISDRKRAEEEKAKLEGQLRHAMKMEAVGTLAGGIAHDFNNALTGILGFGELLRDKVAGNEQASHDLDEILRCAERAAMLTRQLLTFARRQVIDPVNLNLSTLVADLMKLIGKVIGEHIVVTTSLEKNVPTIRADRGQIEQVAMNLCLNARDAMPKGGHLVVETKGVVLEEEYVRQHPYMKTGRYALLMVSDTGIGMDEKTRERVFEPFFTTKDPDKGTGLGLSMAYGIVKQHNGYFHLYSEPGIGTVFKAYFPAIEAPPDAFTGKRREEIIRGGKETILLAEDEEAIRSFIVRSLEALGYNVLVARNGEEAIEIFGRNKEIALAVLDVVMPRKGGAEAFKEMHKRNPRLKVIFMSGYSADAIHDSFVLISGMPLLQKPFGPMTLARKVRETLDARDPGRGYEI